MGPIGHSAELPQGRRSGGSVRWRTLDMLRGVAVLLVLFRHHPASGPLGHIGWVGVDLFFVLSGYLISGLVIDEYRSTGGVNGFRFLVRRGFKIYPSFYTFILLGLPLLYFLGEALPWHNIVAEFFFSRITTMVCGSILGPLPWRSIFTCY